MTMLGFLPDGTYRVELEDGTATLRLGVGASGRRHVALVDETGKRVRYLVPVDADGVPQWWSWDAEHPHRGTIQRAIDVLERWPDPLAAGRSFAERTGRCYRCGRRLTNPTSVAAGIGPECAGAVTGSRSPRPSRLAPVA